MNRFMRIPLLEKKMDLLRKLVRPYLYARYGFHRLTASGAFRKGHVRYVDQTVSPWWNPLKQAIWKHYVKQFHASSCSVASVVSCVNAIRALTSNGVRPITQIEILERITTGHWKERMSPGDITASGVCRCHCWARSSRTVSPPTISRSKGSTSSRRPKRVRRNPPCAPGCGND
ncbi:hypothetical protein [Desulfosarcina cetonica]|uniref:hypothetical protein n=1 Tax=Desulfosarcina cetonica TaxID=90730 RepID=UPI00155D9836|nr:hypothetical protein [Desulfosarcina cetonica]